ncbi:MAG: hypothetical protein ACD_50C00178G0007 [uncultured bacterium]|nr:MAG: hypothetical protein ACD_50C00178G0007 [uncultured bacterium]OGH13872.1 MAG: hypothetical protein A2687_04900 [Candidatus Levybacteria bacterium RIFCSPHIGHO2_01_FULL_38_26]
MKKKVFIIAFILFTIISLSVGQVVVSNRLSTEGIDLQKIEEEIHFYKAQNSTLSEKLFTASSLSNIASRAALLGFVENKSQLVVKTSLPIALKSP